MENMIRSMDIKERIMELEYITNDILSNDNYSFSSVYILAEKAIMILKDFYFDGSRYNPILIPALTQFIAETLQITDYANGVEVMNDDLRRSMNTMLYYVREWDVEHYNPYIAFNLS